MEQSQSVGHNPLAVSIRAEQDRVSALYGHLDAERAHAADTFRRAQRAGGSGYGALMDREASVDEQARRLTRLESVEEGLCFGRIDLHGGDGAPGETLYIGRIGLRNGDREVALVDWRAPAARPFYSATPSTPSGLARRRHLYTRRRTVIGLDDEVFDLEGLSDDDRRSLVGEAALMASLRAGRTGRMHDIVSTIQSEQDRVIRSSLQGALVVQGGPGTGKTVAALHRAAFLLYTHRDLLERRGVLVVGPNPVFLRYIGQVLPSLGETDVVMTTVGGLFPGVQAEEGDGHRAATVKGSLRMAALVEGAVRDRQQVPEGGLEVTASGTDLFVDEDVCRTIRDRARELGVKHNAARTFFANEMLTALAQDQHDVLENSIREAEEAAAWDGAFKGVPELEDPDAPLWTEEDLQSARETLWEDTAVRQAIDGLWPDLTPEALIADLLSDADRLAAAAREAARISPSDALEQEELGALVRPAGSAWTVGDVPLLDEAAELLGDDGSVRRARKRAEERRRQEAERYAEGVLEVTGLSEQRTADGDLVVDADMLSERNRYDGPERTTAERAAADRTWAYGHVIVDEAQELSEMAWRTVMRRIPTRSLTVVGDVAQTGSAAGASSWTSMLERHVGSGLHEERLLVNYRTPAPIMEVAAAVLKEVAPGQDPPESVREGGDAPRAVRIAPGTWEERLPGVAEEEVRAVQSGGGGDPDGVAGRVAVIVPDARHAAFAALLPEAESQASPEVLDAPVAVLTCTQAKGLEFDAVVVAAPDEILEQSPQGGRDLYVAVTRATRRLTVLHEADLPGMLGGLSPA
ncbi:HelD family protein [Nocardiopsis suaedae]|uniref:HelD family protein n=1 Tax=Nocardiopsis suaedae TaxID=3018444 RepID=UPI0038CD21BE